VDQPWFLRPGDELAILHEFQSGPAILRVRARARAGGPRPELEARIGTVQLGTVPVVSSIWFAYEFSLESAGGEQEIKLAQTKSTSLPAPELVLDSVEIADCSELEFCENGGTLHTESKLCSPFACDSVLDCGPQFPGPDFLGTCEANTCAYPTCDARVSAGSFPSYDATYQCFSFAELQYSPGFPHIPNIAGTPEAFECPSIQSLTWGLTPFRGEGSCISRPVCGPNKSSELGFGEGSDPCCYLIARACGV
jgi:hypothetical protein